MEPCQATVFVLVDDVGDFAIGRDADEARENYADQVRPLDEADGFRLVQLKVSIPCAAPVVLMGTAPEMPAPGPMTLTEQVEETMSRR